MHVHKVEIEYNYSGEIHVTQTEFELNYDVMH